MVRVAHFPRRIFPKVAQSPLWRTIVSRRDRYCPEKLQARLPNRSIAARNADAIPESLPNPSKLKTKSRKSSLDSELSLQENYSRIRRTLSDSTEDSKRVRCGYGVIVRASAVAHVEVGFIDIHCFGFRVFVCLD